MNQEERYLSRRKQAERYDKSNKTIERWGDDPALGYPPEIDINGRKFRKLSDLEVWERKRAAIAATRPRKPWIATAPKADEREADVGRKSA
jgi:hypothetical protein